MAKVSVAKPADAVALDKDLILNEQVAALQEMSAAANENQQQPVQDNIDPFTRSAILTQQSMQRSRQKDASIDSIIDARTRQFLKMFSQETQQITNNTKISFQQAFESFVTSVKQVVQGMVGGVEKTQLELTNKFNPLLATIPFVANDYLKDLPGIKKLSRQEQGREPISAETDVPQSKFIGEKNLKDAIAVGESQGNYDVAFMHPNKKLTTPEQFSGGKRLSEMTLDEVRAFQAQRAKEAPNSGAVGKYQFIPSTFNQVARELGVSGNEKFTPEMQERFADQLMKNNAEILQSEGFEPTPERLKMAWWIGAGGASTILRAAEKGDKSSVADVLRRDAGVDVDVRVNPALGKITAAEFEKKMKRDLVASGYKYDAKPAEQVAEAPSVPTPAAEATSTKTTATVVDQRTAEPPEVPVDKISNQTNSTSPESEQPPPIVDDNKQAVLLNNTPSNEILPEPSSTSEMGKIVASATEQAGLTPLRRRTTNQNNQPIIIVNNNQVSTQSPGMPSVPNKASYKDISDYRERLVSLV